jgi:hypothetical protein
MGEKVMGEGMSEELGQLIVGRMTSRVLAYVDDSGGDVPTGGAIVADHVKRERSPEKPKWQDLKERARDALHAHGVIGCGQDLQARAGTAGGESQQHE